MKALVISSIMAAVFARQNINLGPSYRVSLSGTHDWNLINTYSKHPFFVEGLELVNGNTLLQSAGLYLGSQIQIVEINSTGGPLSLSVVRNVTLKSSYFGEGCT